MLLCICIAALIIMYWVILFIICCGPLPAGHVRFRTLPVAGAQTFTSVKNNLLVASRRAVNTDEPELLLTSTCVEFYTWASFLIGTLYVRITWYNMQILHVHTDVYSTSFVCRSVWVNRLRYDASLWSLSAVGTTPPVINSVSYTHLTLPTKRIV